MRSNRLPFSVVATGFALGLVFAASPTAEASPRFTVANDTKTSVKVLIFNGDDMSCDIVAKKKSLSSGKTNTYGCAGNGKGKCKIVVRTDGHDICDKLTNTCDGDAIKVPDGSTLKISGTDPDFNCQLN